MNKDARPPVIQYAHAGRWHTMIGHHVPVEEYENRIENWNLRDEWPRWRVSDASTDGETGAPLEPVMDPTPMTEDQSKDLLRLVRTSLERVLEPEEKARLKEIHDAHRFERITHEESRLLTEIREGRKER